MIDNKIMNKSRYFNIIFPLAAEKLGGTADRVILDSRYTETRYNEDWLYIKNLIAMRLSVTHLKAVGAECCSRQVTGCTTAHTGHSL